MPQQTTIQENAMATIKRLQAKDPGLKQLLKKAHGYAVFPSVGRAAVVVGGAYGRGVVFEKGKPIGYATISQMTLGVQLGGQTFSELVVFESKESLDRFKKGKTTFAANASAVMVKAGASGTADYEKGVLALAYSRSGMLLELAIGGQRFKFKTLDEGDEEQGDEEQGGSKGAKGKSKKADEDEEEGEGEEDESGSGAGLAGKAIGLVKGHPIALTVIGAGLATAFALLMRAGRQASDDDDDEDEAGEAEGSDEGEDEEEGEGDEEGDDEEKGSKSKSGSGSGGGNKPRRISWGRSRA